jgi:hypothetical protein
MVNCKSWSVDPLPPRGSSPRFLPEGKRKEPGYEVDPIIPFEPVCLQTLRDTVSALLFKKWFS